MLCTGGCNHVLSGCGLGGTNIKAALVDADGAIIKEASTPTKLPRPAEAVCDDIAALCNQLAQGQQVAGIGVGCPGTVDGGLVRYSNNLAGMICHGGLSARQNRPAGCSCQ